jgi:hypothetical protein
VGADRAASLSMQPTSTRTLAFPAGTGFGSTVTPVVAPSGRTKSASSISTSIRPNPARVRRVAPSPTATSSRRHRSYTTCSYEGSIVRFNETLPLVCTVSSSSFHKSLDLTSVRHAR